MLRVMARHWPRKEERVDGQEPKHVQTELCVSNERDCQARRKKEQAGCGLLRPTPVVEILEHFQRRGQIADKPLHLWRGVSHQRLRPPLLRMTVGDQLSRLPGLSNPIQRAIERLSHRLCMGREEATLPHNVNDVCILLASSIIRKNIQRTTYPETHNTLLAP